MLSRNGAATNAVDAYGRTPIYGACRDYWVDTVRMLVALGASVIIANKDGMTLLHYTCCYARDVHVGSISRIIVSLLNAGADSAVYDYDQVTSLYLSLDGANWCRARTSLRTLYACSLPMVVGSSFVSPTSMIVRRSTLVPMLLSASASVSQRISNPSVAAMKNAAALLKSTWAVQK